MNNNMNIDIHEADSFEVRKSSASVALTDLNPAVQKKVSKFNVSNDGQLKLEEAIQGLVTMQKQSDNYKKMIWFLIPVLIGLIAATFGSTMLAFKLNQQMQVSGSTLTDMNGQVVKTAQNHATDGDLFDITFSPDFENVDYLQSNHFKIRIDSIIQNVDSNDKVDKVFITTKPFSLTLYPDHSADIVPNAGFENSPAVASFKSIMSLANQKFVVDEHGMKTVVPAETSMKPFVGQTTLVCSNAKSVGCKVYVYYKCGSAWCTRPQ